MSDLDPNPEFDEPVVKRGRPKKEEIKPEPVKEKPKLLVGDIIPKPIPKKWTETEIKERIPHLKGHGLEMSFDEWGSVTFRNGKIAESIHLTSDLKSIADTAERVARGL